MDLVEQLKACRGEGDSLIVCMDSNEHIYKEIVVKALTNRAGLNIVEVVGFTGQKVGDTYFRNHSNKPIGGIWVTPDLTVTGACIMPAGYGVGDYRLFIIDFLTSSLVGCTPSSIIGSQDRRLNTMIPVVDYRYNKALEELLVRHQLTYRLVKYHLNNASK